jgi:hypothetical protein
MPPTKQTCLSASSKKVASMLPLTETVNGRLSEPAKKAGGSDLARIALLSCVREREREKEREREREREREKERERERAIRRSKKLFVVEKANRDRMG